MLIGMPTDSIGVHKQRNECRREIDKTVLQRLLQRDLSLDNVARRLLRRHDDVQGTQQLPQCSLDF
jgi:hypothetical protein